MLLKVATVLCLTVASVLAHDESGKIKAEYLANFDDTAKKIVSLAEAVPAEKYSYKPGEGVRTIAQVYVHIAGANMMIPGMLGAKPPADVKMSRDSEKTMTDKTQIVALLKKAMEHSRAALATALDTPDTAAKLFGRDSNYAGGSLLLVTHMHEHLGQSIAYARAAGVTPPWSGGRGE
ncbi:MAG: DinB family protein [Bryobacteraceae bacterium]|nr:DinB family protein [Bryobacteraceae bacterium]